MPATNGAWGIESRPRDMHAWPLAEGVVASVVLVLALAAFLIGRRATGALTELLPSAALAATAFGAVIWVLAVPAIWSLRSDSTCFFSPWLDRLIIAWLPQLSLMLLAVACSYPGRRVVDWSIWVPAVVASSAAAPLSTHWRRSHQQRAVSINQSRSVALTSHEPGTLLQKLNRCRDDQGSESVMGTVLAEFAAGERIATVHVAFCPPFEKLPAVEAEVTDGASATIKVAQVLHNGARLEVRRDEVLSSPSSILLEFAATQPAN
jgi:hypothetical protein